jgi:putative endonuclease
MADATDFPPEADPPVEEQMDLETAIENAKSSPAVYVLQGCEGEYLYKGSCRDVKQRLADHRAGRVQCTRNRRPLNVVHVEYFDAYGDARRRENALKSGQGRAWLKEQLARVAKWQTQRT